MSRRYNRLAWLILLASVISAPTSEAEWLNDEQLEILLEQTEKLAAEFEQTVHQRLEWVYFPAEPPPDLVQQTIDLAVSTTRLRKTFRAERAVEADVEEVLRRALPIQKFIQDYPVVSGADVTWFALRGRLDDLAAAFGVGWGEGEIDRRPSRASEAQVQALLRGLEQELGAFRKNLHGDLPASTGFEPPLRDNVEQVFEDLQNHVEYAREHLGEGRLESETHAMRGVVASIDHYFQRHPPSAVLGAEWARIGQRVEQLARALRLPEPSEPS